MKVERIAWLGTRTERFDDTTSFFRDVLGLSVEHQEDGFAMFRLPAADRDYVEVFGPDEPGASLYGTGPVVGLLVDDLVGARAELRAAGVELLDETHWPESMPGYGWFHVRAPDGNVYAIVQGSTPIVG